jgi:acyl-coenzyme A thioesterase 9
MRVKTPWIEALTKSREDAQSGQTPRAQGKPDLTPKKMSDSYYSAVSRTSNVVFFARMRME